MSSTDMIDRIQEAQQKEQSLLVAATDILSFVVMWPTLLGLMQMLQPGGDISGTGTLLFVIGVMLTAFTLYGPPYAAAIHSRGKKYITAYIFYGSRMVQREIELIGDPLVIARMLKKEDEEPVIEILDRVDEEYSMLMRVLGSEFLTDTEIDEKIDQLLRARYDRRKEKGTSGRIGRIWKKMTSREFWGW